MVWTDGMTATDYIANTGVLHVATPLRSGGEVVTQIWGVVVDGTPYIRSAYGPGSKWYRRATRSGRAVFVDGPERYPARVESVDDDATIRRVDDAYRTKYAGQDAPVRQMTSPDVRRFTMRVVPAS
jgi:hypothetical protein